MSKLTYVALAVIVLIASAAIAAWSLGLGRLKPPAVTQLSLPGLYKAQEYINANSDLLTKTAVVQAVLGKITAIEPGKRWTIVRNGKGVVVTKEGTETIRYLKRETKAGSSPEPLIDRELKIGDVVLITIAIDGLTGTFTIDSITLIEPAAAE